jgi:protein dithiol oxidoreductase (disulfide-forming)
MMRFVQRTLMMLGLSLITATAMATTASPVDKVDYLTYDKAMSTDAGNKVEVVEFFSYSCPHCFALDPELATWVKAHNDAIVFKRVPVLIHAGDDALQQLYYTIDSMGITEQLHSRIFHAIHAEHKQLKDENAIADFVATQGVDRAKFTAAYESFGVQSKLQRAKQIIENYKVNTVPQLAIDGRFNTELSITQASIGNKPRAEIEANMLAVSDWLVNRAAKEHKQQATGTATKKPQQPSTSAVKASASAT